MSYETAPATKMLATFCACCARPLVDAVSVETGVGPDCRKTHGYATAQTAPIWAEVARFAVEAKLTGVDLFGLGMTVSDVERLAALAESTWCLGGVETRRVANILVHRIAVDQDGPTVQALTNAVRALGYAKLAGRIAARLARVHIDVEGSELHVRTPYEPEAVAVLRAVPGRRWVKGEKRGGYNAYPLTAKRAVFNALKRAFPGATAYGPKGLFVLA